ncbi:ABC transporter ATP-binding protein, partial [Brucella pseudogrignonensis]
MSAQSALPQSELGVELDRSKLEVSKTDVAIEIKNMHKWYG